LPYSYIFSLIFIGSEAVRPLCFIGGKTLGVADRIKNWKQSLNSEAEADRPIVFEALEPRLLLSADSLIDSVIDIRHDTFHPDSADIVCHADSLICHSELDSESHTTLKAGHDDREDSRDADASLDIQPLFSINPDDAGQTSSVIARSEATKQSSQSVIPANEPVTSSDPPRRESSQFSGVNIADEEGERNDTIPIGHSEFISESQAVYRIDSGSESGMTGSDDSSQATNDKENDEKYSSIKNKNNEVRGPPAYSVNFDNSVTSFFDQHTQDSNKQIAPSNSDPVWPDNGLILPGLQLLDPTLKNINSQIVYLNFDGADDVDYNGPVTVKGINVPAFKAPDNLAGQEETIITSVVEELGEVFAGIGVTFTSSRPEDSGPYSTIYIAGDDSAFSDYGSFAGLAEKVDSGNLDSFDNAFVFSDMLLTTDPWHLIPDVYAARLFPRENHFVPGHRACQGCAEPLAVRMIHQILGRNTIVASATGCMEIISSSYPDTAWNIPWSRALIPTWSRFYDPKSTPPQLNPTRTSLPAFRETASGRARPNWNSFTIACSVK